MSPAVQAKLLRVLQEREFQRLGGTKVLKTDARIVAATNRDLQAGDRARRVPRGPLLPPLGLRDPRFRRCASASRTSSRSRRSSSRSSAPRSAGPVAGVSKEAKDLLLAYPWPGNVRELRNALERAAILCDGGLITAAHLPISVSGHEAARAGAAAAAGAAGAFPPGGVDLESMERAYVKEALAKARFNKSKAAKLLGLTRAQLYSRIEKYGLGEPGKKRKNFLRKGPEAMSALAGRRFGTPRRPAPLHLLRNSPYLPLRTFSPSLRPLFPSVSFAPRPHLLHVRKRGTS